VVIEERENEEAENGGGVYGKVVEETRSRLIARHYLARNLHSSRYRDRMAEAVRQ
jgi:hypothetical protein